MAMHPISDVIRTERNVIQPFYRSMSDIAHEVDAQAIGDRLDQVRERIQRACARAGRRAGEVSLIGVTKTFPIEAVHAARDAGLRRFGENRVQELVPKIEKLPGRYRGGDVEWHMIGHLQRNKARDVVDFADYFQALDSPRLARELNKRAESEGRILPCLVQVNVSREQSKYGISPGDTHAFLDRLASHTALRVEGLMTIASFVDDPEEVRSEFQRMRELFETYSAADNPVVEMSCLSMGMSNDFEVAIEEGSTQVRVGSAIFGARNY